MDNEQLPSVLDLIVPSMGPMPQHRREWQVRANAGEQLLALIDRSPEVGETFLDLVLGNEGESHIVWISDWVCLAGSTDGSLDVVRTHWWSLEIECNDSRSYYWDFCGFTRQLSHQLVARFFLKAIALDNRVRKTTFGLPFPASSLAGDQLLSAVQDLVSLPRSRRSVSFRYLPQEAERVAAFHCSPVVELEVKLDSWRRNGGMLAAAMRANRGPARLSLRSLRELWDDALVLGDLARALEDSTTIEELTVDVQHNGTEAVLMAIGRNRSIRDVVAVQEGPVTTSIVRTFWESVMNSPSIVNVDASGIWGDSDSDPFPFGSVDIEGERRDCAHLVGHLIRTNPRITSLTYDPRAHDAHIMESRVVPILRLNRFRPIVASLPGGSVGELAREKSVSGLLGSPLVLDHPELLYCLLHSTRDVCFRRMGRAPEV